jgi:hypothetical protein
MWSADTRMLWDVYRAALYNRELTPLSAADSAALWQARQHLNDIRPVYDLYKRKYLSVLENEADPKTDSVLLFNWRQKFSVVYNDWLAYGRKYEFDYQLGLMRMIYGKSSPISTHELLQNLERYHKTNVATDAGYYFTAISEENGVWTTISVDSTCISRSTQAHHNLIEYTATFDIMRAVVNRPWMQAGVLAGDHRSATNLRAGYPVQVIYARNIRCEKWKTGILIPLKHNRYRVKKTPRSRISQYTSKEKQILGFICERI